MCRFLGDWRAAASTVSELDCSGSTAASYFSWSKIFPSGEEISTVWMRNCLKHSRRMAALLSSRFTRAARQAALCHFRNMAADFACMGTFGGGAASIVTDFTHKTDLTHKAEVFAVLVFS